MEKEMTTQDWNMVSEVELVYKSRVKASLRPQLKKVTDVYEFSKQNWDENKIELLEQFKVILLNKITKCWEYMKHLQGVFQEP